MPEQSLETLVVVVEVPQFDCEVGRAGSKIPALVIECYVVDGIFLDIEVLV